MENKNFRLIFFVYFIIFGIFIALFGSFIGYSMNIVDIKHNLETSSQEVGLSKKFDSLKPDIDKFDAICNALANDSSLESYITNPTDEKRDNARNVFYAITMSDSLIMQTRFIDASGKEKIRVDRLNQYDKPFIVKDADLQDKSKRDYFTIVSHMKDETIWHSCIDLNIEHDKIEVPYRPTLRVAQPIFKNSQFVGMVIVNLLAADMINGLKKSVNFDHFIIDKEGYFILNPDENYSWSRYTNSSIRLYDEFPKEATQILAGVSKGDTFFSIPLDDVLHNDDKAILILKPKDAYKNALLSSNIKTSAIIIFLSILISIPLAIFASTTPAKLQKVLAASNIELKRFADIIDKYVITATTKTNSIITAASTAFAKSSGYSKEELIGQKVSIIKHPDTPPTIHGELWKTIEEGKNWQAEIKNKTKDGQAYYLDQNIIPIKNEDNQIISYMTVGHDVTTKKELERLAEVDKLTGLYNRRKLDEYMEWEIERVKRYHNPLSFMMIDIDHFKYINDTFGHPVGDTTLQALAKILIENLRKSDIVGRYGGEEFLVICPESNGDATMQLAEKIRSVIENHIFKDIEHMTISIGIAQFKENDTAHELLSRADKALYQAKQQGRNRAIFGAHNPL